MLPVLKQGGRKKKGKPKIRLIPRHYTWNRNETWTSEQNEQSRSVFFVGWLYVLLLVHSNLNNVLDLNTVFFPCSMKKEQSSFNKEKSFFHL